MALWPRTLTRAALVPTRASQPLSQTLPELPTESFAAFGRLLKGVTAVRDFFAQWEALVRPNRAIQRALVRLCRRAMTAICAFETFRRRLESTNSVEKLVSLKAEVGPSKIREAQTWAPAPHVAKIGAG